MARSRIREDQVVDADFMSEQEFATASGIINNSIVTASGVLNRLIEDHINNTQVHVVSGTYTSLLDLTDTPTTYSGSVGHVLSVSSTASGVEFVDIYQNIRLLSFDTTSSGIQHKEGQIYWDAVDRTLEIDTEIQGTHIQIGQENVIRCTNKTGVDISNGRPVYIVGAQGHRPTIALADADSDDAANRTIGITTHDIPDNTTGYVTTYGTVRDMDTSNFLEGDCLWVSTISGTITNVEPETPAHAIKVGLCTYSHSTNGKMHVCVNHKGRTTSLQDVANILPTVSGSILVWNTSTKAYEPRSDFIQSVTDQLTAEEREFSIAMATALGG